MTRCCGQFPARARVVTGSLGLPAQRNALLDAVDADIVVFFDDDFLPADDYLIETERLFSTRPEVVVATGQVVADGILGPGIEFDEGVHILETLAATPGRRPRRPRTTATDATWP